MTTTPKEPPNNAWAPLGPYGIELWPYGCISGRVTGIAFGQSPASGKRIYITTANGGVWFSDKNGEAWQPAMNNLDLNPESLHADSLAGGAIAISPIDHKTILVGTGEGNRFITGDQAVALDGLSYEGVGPLRGEYNGSRLAWHTEMSDLAGHAFFELAWDPTNADRVLAATTKGVHRREKVAVKSREGNSTTVYKWSQLTTMGDTAKKDAKVSSVVVGHSGSQTVFYAARWGDSVYRSHDGGNSWTRLPWNGVVTEARVGRIGLAVRPDNPDVVYTLIAKNDQEMADADTLLGICRWDTVNKWQNLSQASTLGAGVSKFTATVDWKSWGNDFDTKLTDTFKKNGITLSNQSRITSKQWRIGDQEKGKQYIYDEIYGLVQYESVAYSGRYTPKAFSLGTQDNSKLATALKNDNKGDVRAIFKNHIPLPTDDGKLSWEQFSWVIDTNYVPQYLVLQKANTLEVKAVFPGLLGAMIPQGEYNLTLAVVKGADSADYLYVGGSFGLGNSASLYRCKVTGSGSSMGLDSTYVGSGVHPDVHALAFEPDDYSKPTAVNPNKLWIGCDGGLYSGDPTGTPSIGHNLFTSRNVGLATLLMEQMGQHPTQDAILYAGTQDNGGLRYTGDVTWHYKWGGDAGTAVVKWSDPTKFIGEGPGGVSSPNFTIDVYEKVLKYPPLVCPPYNPAKTDEANRLATGTHEVLLSDAVDWNQTTWNTIATMAGTGRGARVRALTFASYSKLYVATMDGQIYRLDEKDKATHKWDKTTLHDKGGLPTSYRVPVTSIAVDPMDKSGNSIYVTFGGMVDYRRVWHYSGSSKTWSARSGPNPAAMYSEVAPAASALTTLNQGKLPNRLQAWFNTYYAKVRVKITVHMAVPSKQWWIHVEDLRYPGQPYQDYTLTYEAGVLNMDLKQIPMLGFKQADITALDDGEVPKLLRFIDPWFGKYAYFAPDESAYVIPIKKGERWLAVSAKRSFLITKLTLGSPTREVLRIVGYKVASPSLLDIQHNAIVVDPANPTQLYAGTDIGVWYSTDAGVSWQPYAAGLPETAVTDLQIFPPAGPNGQPASGQPTGASTYPLLRASTYGRGVFERSLKAGFTNNGMHLYLRKNVLDRGLYDLPAVSVLNTLKDADGQRVDYQYSPDIKLGKVPNGVQFINKVSVNEMSFYAFSQFTEATKMGAGDKTAVFLQLQNYGTTWTAPISITLLVNWNVTKGSIPDLPRNYYQNMTAPAAYLGEGWKHLGQTTLKTADLAAAQPHVPYVIGFDVTADFKLHLTGTHCILAIVAGSSDAPLSERNIETLCRQHRRAAIKLVTLS